MIEHLHGKPVRELSAVPWEEVLSHRRERWAHSGRCQCGRRTFLFGRCPTCINEEAAEMKQEAERRVDEEPGQELWPAPGVVEVAGSPRTPEVPVN